MAVGVNASSAQGVTISRIRQDATTVPTNAVTNFSWGENLQGGPLDSLVFRFTTAVAGPAALCAGDFSSLISSISLAFNGDRVHQFNAANNNITTVNQPGQYGYFLNSIGGTYSEIPPTTLGVREIYARIPLGIVLPSGVSRLECQISFAAAANAATGTLEVFGVYNSNAMTQTIIPTSTSSTGMAAGQQQVQVRIPQMGTKNMLVAGILVLNDTQDGAGNPIDNLGPNGITNLSQGPYGLDADFMRLLSGDLRGQVSTVTFVESTGINGGAAAENLAVMAPRLQSPGAIFVPTFGLAASSGDVTLIIDSAAAGSNRIFIPVLTQGISANSQTQPIQKEQVRTNTQKAILDRVDV